MGSDGETCGGGVDDDCVITCLLDCLCELGVADGVGVLLGVAADEGVGDVELPEGKGDGTSGTAGAQDK